MSTTLKGIAITDGIAMGKAKITDIDYEKYLKQYVVGNQEEELAKIQRTFINVEQTLKHLIGKLDHKTQMVQVSILQAGEQILKDPELKSEIEQKIKNGLDAPAAIIETCNGLIALFEMIEDAYLRERATDIKDIQNKLLENILGIAIDEEEDDSIILCGMDIAPSKLASFKEGKVKGIILGKNTSTSHVVIMAKAKGIVTIVGLEEQINNISAHQEIVLDGNSGIVKIDIEQKERENYLHQIEQEKQLEKYYQTLKDLSATTIDGKTITLATNIGSMEEAERIQEYGAQGVGLFRTEFLFMEEKKWPTEEMQFEAYKKIVQKANGSLCIIRTLDIGGDKPLTYADMPKEENPFLGRRAIRMCLEEIDIFKVQIRAILRASHYGRIGIMFPMISTFNELKKAQEIVEESKLQLKNEGICFDENIQIGMMIETPAAVQMADIFAQYCDFFSIGTNDLVQYTLAVDRGNSLVADLYSYFDPAVMRSIYQVVKSAHAKGKWVGMCGEMASDIHAVPFLLSIGIDELSMGATYIPKIKDSIRKTIISKECIEKVMNCTTTQEVKQYLQSIS